MSDNMYRLIKIVLTAIALCVAFLFALNGRYDEVYGYKDVVRDNWTGVYKLWHNGEEVKW